VNSVEFFDIAKNGSSALTRTVDLKQTAKKLNRRNRVKTTLLAAALVVTLTLSAAAGTTKKPAPSQHLAGSTVQKQGTISVPPALCDPCLFYSGDLDPASLNAAGMSDENTLLILGGSSTYASFTLTGISATVTGILFNVQADANFDPQTASYDVRTGVSEGDGGTSIANGTAAIQVAPTGRNFIGLNEFSVAVNLSTPLVLSPGQYWFNITPNCTNGTQDGSCSVGRIFFSNTTNRANGVNGEAQTEGQLYLNSGFFGFTWANWCDSSLGFNKIQYGLMGAAGGN
jgi:hypothetical protein